MKLLQDQVWEGGRGTVKCECRQRYFARQGRRAADTGEKESCDGARGCYKLGSSLRGRNGKTVTDAGQEGSE